MNAGIENINKVKFILRNLPEWMRFTPKTITTRTYVDLFNESTVSVCYPSTIKSPDQLARSFSMRITNINQIMKNSIFYRIFITTIRIKLWLTDYIYYMVGELFLFDFYLGFSFANENMF